MEYFTLFFIVFCFIVQISIWIVSAFSTKKTLDNKGGWLMRIMAIIFIVFAIILKDDSADLIPVFGLDFWNYSLSIGIIADLVTLSGVIFMIWARFSLGKNWSANVVLKEDHELITSGPYKYVRHPIYSGLLLMILGIAIYSGSFVGFFLFVLFFIGAYYKASKEEKLLIKYFPEQYPKYIRDVRALIPFVL
ncbi:MAG: isoprenylcysteine carboxylmethyltransferase family protein [Candidatus Paceibacterota bacterium]|jgi:protein-S-isoprenylcysteine O-methyltransferase Ste14